MRRLLSFFIAFCLIFTQTAQAYSLARLPYEYQRTAIQATTSLINNKGNIGKTLDDMGKSENVKALVTAMLTAGVMQSLGNTAYMQGLKEGANASLSATSIISKFELSLTTTTVNTAINSAEQLNRTRFFKSWLRRIAPVTHQDQAISAVLLSP